MFLTERENMSFSFNGPSFRPMIQESQSMKNNGGGGNTGYYQRGRKKKEKKIDVFSEAENKDSFTLESEINSKEAKGNKLLDKIIEKTKNIVKKPQPEEHQNTPSNPFKPMSESEE